MLPVLSTLHTGGGSHREPLHPSSLSSTSVPRAADLGSRQLGLMVESVNLAWSRRSQSAALLPSSHCAYDQHDKDCRHGNSDFRLDG